MDGEYIPAHIRGRNFDLLDDPAKTLNRKGLAIGGYIRVSTSKDGQKSSIENQQKLLEQWSQVNGYRLARCYTDVKTGKYLYVRNEVREMLDDIKKGHILGLVSKEIARTSRDIMDVLDIKRKIVASGGFFLAIKENYDSRSDDDEFLLVLYGALAQKEQKTTASRVKVTQLIKAREGKTNVAHPAYGYMLSTCRQYLVRNPETAPVFRFIVEKFMDGWGQLKIAKYLNSNGIPGKRGGMWHTSSIKIILANPVYLGVTIYNATTLIRDAEGRQKRVLRPREEWIERQCTHEPLMTEEEYRKIQVIMLERKGKDCRDWSCERKYLGSGLLRCAVCRGKIYGTRYRSKKKSPGYLYRYVCRGMNGSCASGTKYWDAEKVDCNIRELFSVLFGDRERLYKYLKREPGLFPEHLPDAAKLKDDLLCRLEQVERAVSKQQAAYETEALTMEEYKVRMAELRKKKKEIDVKISALDAKLLRRESGMGWLDGLAERITGKFESIHELPREEVTEYINVVFKSLYLGVDGSIVEMEFNI